MNEKGSAFENQNEDASISHDPMEETLASQTELPPQKGEAASLQETNEDAVDVFANTGTDPDLDCEDIDSTDQKNELDELRGELMQLRHELEESHTRLAQMEHIERQYAEFCELYPDVSIHSLSSEVWQSVGNGTPLAAAFALAEHRKALSLKKATDSNADNRARSAGAVKSTESIEFSPAEVRAMSPTEVRANLPKIMRSMQKWH